MKRKSLSVFLAFTMVLTLAMPKNTTNTKADVQPQWNTSRYGDKIDIGAKLRAQENDPVLRAKMDEEILNVTKNTNFDVASSSNATTSDSNFTYNGGTKKFLGYDSFKKPTYYYKSYTLRSIGEKVEVWVADDLSFPVGDTRTPHVVTQEQVDSLRDEFDNNIYQKDTEFFGMPDSHTGMNPALNVPKGYYASSDGKERVIMLVDNVKDESYYDASYPFYIAGFFSPTFERYIDRNIINIDSNKWDKRIPSKDIYGTIAHEFQHLIHSDNDSSEEKWINEGMSDFAQYLCGYGHDWGHVNYFLDHPENSLVSWDEYYSAPTGPETLADYGQAYLLQLYLNDHFGKDLIKALAKDKDHGMVSLNKIMKQFNTGIDFNELFRRFSCALIVDSKNPGEGMYNFDSIDVKVNTQAALEHQKDGVPAWGVDYLKLQDTKNIKDIIFDGISFYPNPNPWKVIDDPRGGANKVAWGNKVDKNDNKLVLQADLTTVSSATLKFDHYYFIEDSWDYGMVQVSTDNGKTWVSLSNANTRTDLDPSGKDNIRQNLPGFTGTNNNWSKEQFDLTPYAGKNILIDFRYMTDDAATEEGWFVDNIEIPEIKYINDCSNIDSFVNLQKLLGNYVNYSITFINEKYTNKGTEPQHYQVKTIDLVNMKDGDAVELQKFLSSGNNYMLVWYAAPEGNKGAVDYSYDIVLKNKLTKVK